MLGRDRVGAVALAGVGVATDEMASSHILITLAVRSAFARDAMIGRRAPPALSRAPSLALAAEALAATLSSSRAARESAFPPERWTNSRLISQKNLPGIFLENENVKTQDSPPRRVASRVLRSSSRSSARHATARELPRTRSARESSVPALAFAHPEDSATCSPENA